MSPALFRGLVTEFGKARTHVRELVHDVFQEVHLQIVLGGVGAGARARTMDELCSVLFTSSRDSEEEIIRQKERTEK
jgi:hypothetical protein